MTELKEIELVGGPLDGHRCLVPAHVIEYQQMTVFMTMMLVWRERLPGSVEFDWVGMVRLDKTKEQR